MKKDVISLLALMLAAAALVLAIVAVVRKPELECGHKAEIEALQSELTAMQAQLDALQTQNSATSAPGGRADLFINQWEERDGTLTLTDGYIQVQLSSGTAISKVQLVLLHNGIEDNRIDLMLDSGEAEGIYQCTLMDTWFLLPELKEDDMLEVKLEVHLSSGEVLSSGDNSWYATADGLYAVVG